MRSLILMLTETSMVVAHKKQMISLMWSWRTWKNYQWHHPRRWVSISKWNRKPRNAHASSFILLKSKKLSLTIVFTTHLVLSRLRVTLILYHYYKKPVTSVASIPARIQEVTTTIKKFRFKNFCRLPSETTASLYASNGALSISMRSSTLMKDGRQSL